MADQRALIGTSLDQVSTNAMLGTLAFQDADGAYIETIRGATALEGFNKDIADTAVDVFVYDTHKDSDGGAWRHRTQHTSWYNETLNTATRGSRREFPAVAVIVAEDAKVTIYDGDDPDLPMWMVFQSESGNSIKVLRPGISSIFAINGFLSIGHNGSSTSNRLTVLNFIKESGRVYYGISVQDLFVPFSERNQTELSFIYAGVSGVDDIVNRYVNDVAMTVLPNAPIDSTTGLPIPTIAVATDGGVSVIKDDGIVVNYTRGGNEYTGSVAFDELNDLIISWGTSLGGYRHATRITNPFVGSTILDTTYGYIASDLGMGGSAAGNVGGVVTVANSGRHFGIDFDSSSGVPATQNNHDDRVNFLHINDADTTKSLVAYATTSYNTGWMHGAIKGAFLSDTDATNTSELVTNGTFDSDTSGWNSGDPSHVTLSQTGGVLQVAIVSGNDGSRYAYQQINNVPPGTYRVTATSVSNASNRALLRVGTSDQVSGGGGNATNIFNSGYLSGNNVTSSHLFTTTETSNIVITLFNDYTSGTGTWDNVKLHRAEEDRSVNSNPLQVFGTITKSAVATGAELVGYSGFSNSTNYLSQPLNSDLAIGNSDFSCVGWFKKSTSSNTGIIIFASDGNNQVFDVRVHTDMKMLAQITDDGFSTREIVSAQGPTVNDNIWHQFHVVRRSNILYSYLDGNLLGTSATVEANITNPMGITIGAENLDAYQKAFEGSISLIRFSKSAPSPEQIKKIYEDEKVLFQENAACTLYGSSDAVTALAYDPTTSLLHVGTSSGRSEFKGLRRVGNTTTAVTTAISASSGLVAEQ